MIDFDPLVFAPVYDTFGKPAVLLIGQTSYYVAVIDNTKGVTVEDSNIVGVQTVRPAADVRRSVLDSLGIALDVLVDGALTFDSTTWRIKSFLDNNHEVRLILAQAN